MNRRNLSRVVWAVVMAASVSLTACQSTAPREATPAVTEASERDAEIGCAMCIYHMPGVKDCVLAVKLDGRAYLVKGSSIDDHGDAHAADGLCNTGRKARVRGRVEGEVFVAEVVELMR